MGPSGDLTRPDEGSPRGWGGGVAPAQCGETDKEKWGPERENQSDTSKLFFK